MVASIGGVNSIGRILVSISWDRGSNEVEVSRTTIGVRVLVVQLKL